MRENSVRKEEREVQGRRERRRGGETERERERVVEKGDMPVEAGRCEAFKPDQNEAKIMAYAAQVANFRSPLTAWIASMRMTPGERDAQLRSHLGISQHEQQFVRLYEADKHYDAPLRTSIARVQALRHEREPSRGDAHRALFEYSR